jgi:hypothetical protein
LPPARDWALGGRRKEWAVTIAWVELVMKGMVAPLSPPSA